MASARRKKDGEGKRYPLNMRTTKEVRDLLERAAARSGRSLVQEVEYRIESSFRDDRWLKGIGGANAELVVRAILHFLGLVQARVREGKRDTEIADAVSRGIGLIADCVLEDRGISRKIGGQRFC